MDPEHVKLLVESNKHLNRIAFAAWLLVIICAIILVHVSKQTDALS